MHSKIAPLCKTRATGGSDDEVKYSKDREQITISTNEAYEVVPKMEGNATYGVTCHQSSEVSSH